MSRGYKTELGHATCVSTFILLFECGRRPQLHLLSLRLIAHWLRTKKLELASPFCGKQQSMIKQVCMLKDAKSFSMVCEQEFLTTLPNYHRY